MSYLTGLHHTRIAYIGGSPLLKIEYDRFAAYKAGLSAADIRFDSRLVAHGNLTPEGGYQAAQHLLSLDQPPTAIACINDSTAIGAIHAAYSQGLVVGHDIAIAGFDGIADAAHTQPPLTTLEQPVYSVAQQLMKMLLAHIAGDTLFEKQVKIQPKLLIRPSTGEDIKNRSSQYEKRNSQ
jgi:DNA-binding LacI/PurR family transcriptional regulator